MNAQTLLDNFSTLANAPGGIPRLRELILDLAVNQMLLPNSSKPKRNNAELIELGEILTLEYGKPLEREARSNSAKIPAYGANGVKTYTNAPLVDRPGIVVGRKGSAGQVNLTSGPFWPLDVTFYADFDDTKNDVRYLYYLLRSLDLPALARGIKPGINRNDVHKLNVFKITLEMQTAIVRKVDELMALCDQLEAAKTERDSLGAAARKSAIDAVSIASSADELSTAWARIQDNWTTYADTPESISDLRSIIHDLAVRGVLADNQPTELPFDVENVEGPYEIPSNWRWAKLEDIANYGGRGNVQPLSIRESDWILDLEDIEKSSSRLLQRVYASARKTTSNKASFEPGDVLYGKLRPYLDKVLVADEPGFCTTEIVPITPLLGIDSYWLRLSLKSPLFIQYVIEKSYGMKMPRLGTKDAKASIHAVPPLAEQVRIVAKVDELMALCDQLENELKTRHVFAGQWAASVVHHIGDAA
jgi:restriction endonuclease S subunit